MPLIDDLYDGDLFEDEPGPAPGDEVPNAIPGDPPSEGDQQELNANRRRPRSSSEPDAEEDARLTWRAFMESAMDTHNIRGTDREQGRRFADLDFTFQLMFFFSFMLAQRARVDNLATFNFLRGNVYETHVVSRIRVALLAPWLTNYVTLLQEWIINDILCAKESWRVPDAVTTIAEQWQQFCSELKSKMTQVRSQNKGMMLRLCAKGADINEIVKALAPQGMVIKEPHRGRVAWIMLASVEFDQLVVERRQKSSKFWEWIGTELLALKTRIANDTRYTTDLQRRKAMSNIFTRALARHREQFPPLIPVEPPQARPGWQESLEDAMNLGAVV